MKFINLDRQYSRIKTEIDLAIQKVISRSDFIMGEEVFELEKELQKYLDIENVICCASGTDALLASLMALGVKTGDYIITTTFTFVATAEVISLLGAIPLFADILIPSYNINPESVEEILRNSGKKVKGIIAVDLFGYPCLYEWLKELADEFKLFIIQDAAQSFGSTYKGKQIGHYSDIATTSFFPTKPLGCYGDGGAVITKSSNIAKKVRSIIQHGKGDSKYDNIRIGFNGRMDTIQAAILLEKLKIFDDELNLRKKLAKEYTKRIERKVYVPTENSISTSSWAQYSILLGKDSRNGAKVFLKKLGIPTNIYYPTPLHLQHVYNNGESLGNAEDTSREILSLPMCPYLKSDEIEYICNSLISYCEL